MRYDGVMRISPSSVPWQDYRSSETGMIVTYDSDPVSEMAIREVPEELPSEVLPEPNYETKTYGLYGCARNKFRSAFVKSKMQYLFFLVRYQGTNQEFRDKTLITGMYRVSKVADVHKYHLRYLSDAACMEADTCDALLAETAHFVSLEDAMEVTSEKLKSWGYKARVTKQTRVVLDEEQAKELASYLESKANIVDQYIEETKRLQPHDDDDEEDEE